MQVQILSLPRTARKQFLVVSTHINALYPGDEDLRTWMNPGPGCARALRLWSSRRRRRPTKPKTAGSSPARRTRGLELLPGCAGDLQIRCNLGKAPVSEDSWDRWLG